MNNEKIKSEKEKQITSYLIKKCYGFSPKYIETKIDIPDCYFEHNETYYAVEVTRYFFQESEKRRKEYYNNLKKYTGLDFIKNVYYKLGKTKEELISIIFNNINSLKKIIISGIEYINYIVCNNNYYFVSNKKIIATDLGKKYVKIDDIINEYLKNIAINRAIEILVNTKKGNIMKFRFLYIKDYPEDFKISYSHIFLLNEEEEYTKIVNCIINKTEKLKNEYVDKLKSNEIKYDKYILIVYSEGCPSDIDEQKLYDLVKANQNIEYDSIIVCLFNKIILISNNELKIVKNI